MSREKVDLMFSCSDPLLLYSKPRRAALGHSGNPFSRPIYLSDVAIDIDN